VAASSSSSTAASWTSNDVAPATAEEIKAASYLIISAASDDFVPEVYTTLPRKLHHFIDEVKDGTAIDASFKFAKDTQPANARTTSILSMQSWLPSTNCFSR
jgi:hypothetical protein